MFYMTHIESFNSPHGRHMAVDMDDVEMRHGRISDSFPRLGFVLFDAATFRERVYAENLVRLEFVTFAANAADEAGLFAEFFHLLHHGLTLDGQL